MADPRLVIVKTALKTIEQFQKFLTSIDRIGTIKKLRALLDTLDEIGHLENELSIYATRLRRMLGEEDRDKTPAHGISTKDLKATNPRIREEENK